MDTVDEKIMVSARQVRSSDAVVKQNVSANQRAVFLTVKCNMTRGMSGYEKDDERLVAQFNIISLLEETIGRLMLVKVKAITRRVHFDRFEHSLFDAMYQQIYLIGFFYKLISQHMVDMAMGIQQEFYAQLFLFNEGSDL
jgi:hypothetical protein